MLLSNSSVVTSAICTRINETAWEVFCCNCIESIGSMNGDTLRDAIMNMANRGGVLCPDCRDRWCNHCGIVHSTKKVKDDCDFIMGVNYWGFDEKNKL